LFVWNLQYPSAEKFDGIILWAGSLSGPVALPGIYHVTLKIGDKEQTQSFEIRQDPRSEGSEAALLDQFNFIQSVNSKVSEAHLAIKQIREVRKQLEEITPALKAVSGSDNTQKMADDIQKRMTEVEENLYQTKNRSNQDPLNFPIRLTNKLAYLNTISRSGDYKPSSQVLDVRSEIIKQIDHELGILKRIFDEELPEFNEAYRALGMDAVRLKPQKTDGLQ
jgi:hypothetical protein